MNKTINKVKKEILLGRSGKWVITMTSDPRFAGLNFLSLDYARGWFAAKYPSYTVVDVNEPNEPKELAAKERQ